jgi:hypothetical protein
MSDSLQKHPLLVFTKIGWRQTCLISRRVSAPVADDTQGNHEEKANGQIFPGLAIGRTGSCSGPDLFFHALTAPRASSPMAGTSAIAFNLFLCFLAQAQRIWLTMLAHRARIDRATPGTIQSSFRFS